LARLAYVKAMLVIQVPVKSYHWWAFNHSFATIV